jgi:tetratricopeptide (TPR) repeat protein
MHVTFLRLLSTAALAIALVPVSALAQVPGTNAADPGDAAYRAKDYAAAAAAYGAAVTQAPKNGLAWYRLGVSLAALGRYDEAGRAYRSALDNAFDAFSVHYRTAQLATKRGDAAQAVAELEAAVKARPFDPETLASDDAFAPLAKVPQYVAFVDRQMHAFHLCRYDAAFHALDFWIGSWIVRNAAGAEVGRSRIEPVVDGCAIRENWTGRSGNIGQSLSSYDPATKTWTQHYVDSAATRSEYAGGVDGKDVVMTAPSRGPGGAATLLRMRYTPMPDGRVRQLIESSADDGKTWSVAFDGYYEKAPP